VHHLHCAKRGAQRIDLIDEQTISVSLGKIDGEEPGSARHGSTAVLRHLSLANGDAVPFSHRILRNYRN